MTGSTPARVLVVCTANVCRSPMGEALLRQQIAQRGGSAVVASAGTRVVDLPVYGHSVEALADRGVDISSHQPRQLTRELIRAEGADLVIVMTRSHLREVVTRDRSAFTRTFTLRELGRRIATAGRDLPSDLAGWTTALSYGRRATDLMGDDADDDLADPYGMGLAEVRRSADEIERIVRLIAAGAPWPST